MRIGVDLDGILYDFVGALERWCDMPCRMCSNCGLTRHYRKQVPATTWEFYREWGWTASGFRNVCDEGVNADYIFLDGPPTPGSVDALHTLRSDGHTIILITARDFGAPGKSEELTRRWLQKYGVPYDELHFNGDKTSVPTDVFLEDCTENLIALEEAGPTVAYAWDQPWNQDWKGARVGDWGEFVDQVWWVEKTNEWLLSESEYVKPGVKTFDWTPETILEEAQRAVHGERGDAYGHPFLDFSRTGRMWGAILSSWAKSSSGDEPVPPNLVGLCMVALKLSREVNKPKRDNRVDMAGYAETVDMIATHEADTHD